MNNPQLNRITIKTEFAGPAIQSMIEKGEIHVVCVAKNGLTALNVYAELCCKMAKETVNLVVDQVNSKKETGTLYPEANITILPITRDWNKEDDDVPEDLLRVWVLDVFIANKEYIRSEKIYFVLESGYIDINKTHKVIEDVVNAGNLDDPNLKEVVLAPLG